MKNRKRIGGILRLLFFICILFVLFVGIRAAAGTIFHRGSETKAEEQTSEDKNSEEPTSEEQTTQDRISQEQTSVTEAGSELSAASGSEYTQAVPSAGSTAQEETAAPQISSQTKGLETGTDDALSAAQDATAAAAEEMAETEEANKPAYDHVATELENGQAYLVSLEERTPVEMEYMIEEARKEHEKQVQREKYQKKRDDYLQSLEGNALWEAFDDFVFLGDSRVVGFDIYGFLPSERVLAAGGDTINSITDRMDTIKEISPKYIFISYGINDIGIGYWSSKEEYTAAFEEKIHTLQKELPDAEIYVNSIIPAREDAVQMYPIWEGLPEYSEAVRQMCEQENISFIDNEKILSEYEDPYSEDGIHLQRDFYRYWAENQLLGIFDHENGLLSF